MIVTVVVDGFAIIKRSSLIFALERLAVKVSADSMKLSFVIATGTLTVRIALADAVNSNIVDVAT